MTNYPFDGFGGMLGGLAKSFVGFMPQDDPDIRLFTLQNEVSELQRQETELYAQIGKQVLAEGGKPFPEIESKLKLIRENLTEAQEQLKQVQEQKDAQEEVRLAEEAACTCPECGNINPEGVKFCQECGAKLGTAKCRKCGATLAPGTRFCGECGAKQEE